MIKKNKILKEQLKKYIFEDAADILLESKGGSIIQQLNDVVEKYKNKEYSNIGGEEHHLDLLDQIRTNIDYYTKKLEAAKQKGDQNWIDFFQNKINELVAKLSHNEEISDPFTEMQKIAYNHGLQSLGKGSSRITYELPVKSYVLKVAKNRFGIEQNKQEISVYTNPNIKDIVPRIYPKSDLETNLFLIVEKVNQFNSAMDFYKNKGYYTNIFSYIELYGFNWKKELIKRADSLLSPKDLDINLLCNGNVPEEYEDLYTRGTIGQEITFQQVCNAIKDENWLDQVVYLIKSEKLKPGDLTAAYHSGTTIDGRIVFLDTGFSDESAKFMENKQIFLKKPI